VGAEDNLKIRKYDYFAPHSITIVDRNDNENAWIRVEHRQSYAAQKKDDGDFFSKYSDEYDISSHLVEQKCKSVLFRFSALAFKVPISLALNEKRLDMIESIQS
jgi:hypothetical protein